MSGVGLVLGSGGVLGAAWTIGALTALEALTGLDPREAQNLVGTSAGSVLAASLGCGVGVATLADHQAGRRTEGQPALEFDYEAGTGGGLPPRPALRLGSHKLLLTATLSPWKVTPMGVLAAVLPQGRGSLAPVGALIETMRESAGSVAGVPPADGAPAPARPGWAPHPATWIVAMDHATGRRVAFGRPGAPPAGLAQAVMASCAIPGWFAPQQIGGRRYVDGGACSPASLDLLAGSRADGRPLDMVVVLSPMTSFDYDDPAGVGARVERRVRRLTTRRLVREAARVRAAGTKVVLLGPGPEDLAGIGANLMDPRRREAVFATSLRTSSAALGRALARQGLAEAG